MKKFLKNILAISLVVFSVQIIAQDSISLVGNLAITGLPIHDVWGYTDSITGNKYALVCASDDGLRVVNVNDMANPIMVGSITGVEAIDVKVWKNYAYVVGESNKPGSVIDLSDPTNPTHVGSFPSAHNITISEFGFIYLSVPGLRIMDLNQNPINPVQVYLDNTCQGHDISIIGDRLYDFPGICGTRIFDVSRPDTLVLLGTLPAGGYQHSGWTSKDGNYLFVCDELAQPSQNDITVWDISDLSNPIKVDSFADANAYVHNIYIEGDFAYVSYYRAGFRVFNVSDPTQMVLVDTYDTDPSASGPGYGGNFGLFTNWGKGTILATDEDNGLFIFAFSGISTGIEEFTELKNWNVFPNPATNLLTLTFENSASDKELRIYNSVGQLVLFKVLNTNSKYAISTQDLPAGMYVLDVRENQKRSVKQLIISK